MKKVARELRIITDVEDKKKLRENPFTNISSSKRGIYKHGTTYFEYVGSNLHIDYFEEMTDPLRVGLKIKDLNEELEE